MNNISRRYIFIGPLLCLLLTGCIKREPELDPYPQWTHVWADPTESAITLQWKYGYSAGNYSHSPVSLVVPKRIDVYFGELPSDLTLYKTLPVTDTLLQFTGLISGKQYYFKVHLITDNPYYSYSENVMAIPGKYNPLKPVRLPADITTFNRNSIAYLSYFQDTTKVLIGYRDAGTFLHNLKTNRWVKLSEQAGYPAWSKSNTKLAIGTHYAEIKSTPASMDIFDFNQSQDSLRLIKRIRLPSSWLAGYIWSQDEKSIFLDIPIPTPSPVQQLFVANDSLTALGSPARYNKYSFVWLDENRLLLGGSTSLNGGVHGYNAVRHTIAATASSSEPIVFNLSKGSYESLTEHPQLHEIGFPTPIDQASKIAYLNSVSGYAAVWLYDMKTRTSRPLTTRLSNGLLAIHGLQWIESHRMLNLYYSDYSSNTVVHGYSIPF